VLAKELSATKVPTLAVLGNHDFRVERGRRRSPRSWPTPAGVIMLDGTRDRGGWEWASQA